VVSDNPEDDIQGAVVETNDSEIVKTVADTSVLPQGPVSNVVANELPSTIRTLVPKDSPGDLEQELDVDPGVLQETPAESQTRIFGKSEHYLDSLELIPEDETPVLETSLEVTKLNGAHPTEIGINNEDLSALRPRLDTSVPRNLPLSHETADSPTVVNPDTTTVSEVATLSDSRISLVSKLGTSRPVSAPSPVAHSSVPNFNDEITMEPRTIPKQSSLGSIAPRPSTSGGTPKGSLTPPQGEIGYATLSFRSDSANSIRSALHSPTPASIPQHLVENKPIPRPISKRRRSIPLYDMFLEQ